MSEHLFQAAKEQKGYACHNYRRQRPEDPRQSAGKADDEMRDHAGYDESRIVEYDAKDSEQHQQQIGVVQTELEPNATRRDAVLRRLKMLHQLIEHLRAPTPSKA